MELQILNTDSIKISKDRLLSPNKKNINTLAQSFIDNGFLFNPILVDTDYNLLSGGDRLFAMKKVGEKTIPCFIINTLDKNKLKLIEIDENLKRKEMSIYDKKRLIAARKKTYEKLFPDSTKAFKSKNNALSVENREEVPMGYAEALSEDLGCSTKTITNAANEIEKLQDKSEDIIETLAKVDKKIGGLSGVEITTVASLPIDELEKLKNDLDTKLQNKEDIDMFELLNSQKELISKEETRDLIFKFDLLNYISNDTKYTTLKSKINIDIDKATKLKKSKNTDYTSIIKFMLSNI